MRVLIVIGVVVAFGIIPGLVLGQLTPDDGPVDYGPTITTDREKLSACYSLLRQLVDEYNRQSKLATLNPAKYEDKFRRYAHEVIFPAFQELANERNDLMARVREANFTNEEWKYISQCPPEYMIDVYMELYGDKVAESELATVANCDLLDEVKLVVLDDIIGLNGTDPLEDFYNDYTEYDEGNDITITSGAPNTITFVNLHTRADTCYVYDDKGSGHFDGDFEHRVKSLIDTFYQGGSGALVVPYLLANVANKDYYDMIVDDDDALLVRLYYHSTYGRMVGGYELDDGQQYPDDWYSFNLDEYYYLTPYRDDDADTYGHFYVHICEDNFYGESGSDWKYTSDLELHDRNDFQYVYGLTAYDSAGSSTNVATGEVTDLDLQETGPTWAGYSFGYIIGG